MAETSKVSVIQLAEQLGAGFAALSGEYQRLFDQQRQLENKLSFAKQQYLDLLKRLTPSTLSQDHLAFLQDLDRVTADQSPTAPTWTDHIQQSSDPERKSHAASIRQAEVAGLLLRNATEDVGVKIWSGASADKGKPSLGIQPVMSHMEKDFTTVGTPSKLGCPFAERAGRRSPLGTPRSSTSRLSFQGRRSKRPSFTDPIRAEICGNDQVSASASIEGSAAVCPIRFLDQHAPEEVAKYFENHKHEIPRSHEVCIKRFQSNAESIQQLDRKYGNLVSMIQGLGQKHQEFLPPEPEDTDEPEHQAPTEQKVEKWAKAVTASLQNLTPDEAVTPDHAVDEARTAHFDRPLKEVRVGESPSRPWGISIPAKYTNAESSSSVGSVPTASPALPTEAVLTADDTPAKPSKCPFDHALGKAPEAGSTARSNTHGTRFVPGKVPDNPSDQKSAQDGHKKPTDELSHRLVPQMIFNGPVFFGHPPEQLMSILQNSNLGGVPR